MTDLPVSFGLTDEQMMIQKLARDFSQNEIAPVANTMTRRTSIPGLSSAKPRS